VGQKEKKYVRASTLEAKKKMIANESGVLVDAKAPLKVSKYEQWSRKTKKKIPVVGEKENAATVKEVLAGGRKYRHNQVQPSEEDAKLGLKTKEEIHKERKRKEKRKFGPKKKSEGYGEASCLWTRERQCMAQEQDPGLHMKPQLG